MEVSTYSHASDPRVARPPGSGRYRERVERVERLDRVLRQVMDGDTSVDLGLGDDPDPFALGLEALRLFWDCDHAGCARVAARALA